MPGQTEIEAALAEIAGALNGQGLDGFETRRVQRIVDGSLGEGPKLKVDDGGGLHDESGARVGAIRRTPSGEWIVERQNETAEGSASAIPSKPPESMFKKVLGRLRS